MNQSEFELKRKRNRNLSKLKKIKRDFDEGRGPTKENMQTLITIIMELVKSDYETRQGKS